MSNIRSYISFDPARDYPAGKTICYECLLCGATIPSIPKHAAACECRNIIVDVDAGRVAVKNAGKMRAFIGN